MTNEPVGLPDGDLTDTDVARRGVWDRYRRGVLTIRDPSSAMTKILVGGWGPPSAA
jgi:hypothetical protein